MSKTKSKTRIRPFVAAAIVALSASGHALLPSTNPGAIDPTFNAGASPSLFTGDDFALAVVAQADGRTVVAGHGLNAGVDMTIGFVARYNVDGTLDHAFGDGGARLLGDAAHGNPVVDVVALPEGGMLLVGQSVTTAGSDLSYAPWMMRIDGGGRVDGAFGTNGEVVAGCAPRAQCYHQKAARLSDGRIALLLGAYDVPYGNLAAFVDRYNADGTRDVSFGANGRVVLAGPLAGLEPSHIAVDAQGCFVISGTIRDAATGRNNGVVARLTAAGVLDPAFNGTGVIRASLDGLGTEFRRFDLQPDGRIVVAAMTYNPVSVNARYQAQVLRVNVDGTIDLTFGAMGVARLGGGTAGGVKVQADGKLVFFGQGINARYEYVPMVGRLTANGQRDFGFGVAGLVLPQPSASGATLAAASIGDDNRMTFAGYAPSADTTHHSTLTRVIGVETTTPVVEFYNSALDHYFITADPAEAASIDGGAAGPGWSRTGTTWKSGGPARVCRFYGSRETSKSTGEPLGPNGHFYTISLDECSVVKADAGWQFESFDFSGWPKAANGACTTGTVAVKRVYNNRFAQNDSNHRYTTSDAIYDEMIAQGWAGEGTVFCVPQ